MPDQVRIDKWLWAARVFKTRSQAATACHQGKVSVGETTVKASRDVRTGDIIVVKKDELTRAFKVLKPLEKRLGAAAVKQFVEEQTPEAEFQKARERRVTPVFYRPKGAGRPTKKERRVINDILEQF